MNPIKNKGAKKIWVSSKSCEEDRTLSGEINIEAGKENHIKLNQLIFGSKEEKIEKIEWKSSGGGSYTSLCNRASMDRIIPRWLVQGENPPDEYDGFDIRFSTFSKWMLEGNTEYSIKRSITLLISPLPENGKAEPGRLYLGLSDDDLSIRYKVLIDGETKESTILLQDINELREKKLSELGQQELFQQFKKAESSILESILKKGHELVQKKSIEIEATNGFDISVKTDKYGTVQIKTTFSYQESETEEEDTTQIEKYIHLSISYKDSHQKIENIYNHSFELRQLFSFIIGFLVNPVDVFLKSKEKRHKLILNSLPLSSPFQANQAIVKSPLISQKNNGWEDIFTKYYSKEKHIKFEKIYSRALGLLSYDGFWEFNILYCVSIIDSYASEYCKGKGPKIAKKEFRDLNDKFKRMLDECRGKDIPENDIIYKGLQEALQDKNTAYQNLQPKFEFLIKNTDQAIISILEISSDDFLHAKKIKNSGSHGYQPKTKVENEITKEYVIMHRLILLLLYYMYQDIGLTTREVINALSISRNNIVLAANINKKKIDEYLGRAVFINVSKNTYDACRKRTNYAVLRYHTGIDTYCIDKDLTRRILSDYFKKHNKNRDVLSFLKEITKTESSVTSIDYFLSIYMVCETESIQANSTYIINIPEDIKKHAQKEHEKILGIFSMYVA